jgi:hypothetical protein
MGRSYLNAPRFNAGDIPSLDRRTGAGSPAVMRGRLASGSNELTGGPRQKPVVRIACNLTFDFDRVLLNTNPS